MINYISISGVIIFILSFFTGVAVIINNYNKLLNIKWALFSLSIAFWALGLFLAFVAQDKEGALFYSRYLNLEALFIPVFFIDFVYSYLNKNNRIIKYYYYLSTIMFGLFAIFPNMFVKSVSAKLGMTYYPDAGLLYFVFPLFYSLLVIEGGYLLYKEYKWNLVKRDQLKILFIAMAIGFGGGSTTFAPLFNLPIYPFGLPGVAVLVVLVAFAITKYELLDIKVVIPRTISYVITFVFVSIFYVFTFFLFREDNKLLFFALFILSSMLAFLGNSIQKAIQTPLESKWIVTEYDHNAIIRNLSLELLKTKSRDQVYSYFNKFIIENIKVKNTIVYKAVYANENIDHYSLSETTGKTNKYYERDISINEISSKIITDEKNTLINFFIDDYLDGFIVVGEKQNELAYTDDDLSLLQSLSTLVSYKIESVFYLEKSIRSLETVVEIQKSELDEKDIMLRNSEKIGSLANAIKEYNHEIRTPLSSIKQWIILFSKGRYLDNKDFIIQKSKDLVERVKKIEDILATTLSLSADQKTGLDRVDVIEILNNLKNNFDFTFVDYKYECKISSHVIDGNYQEVKMIFNNIVKNAMDAMSGKGAISVFVNKSEKHEGKIKVEITDTGGGMPEEVMKKIFDPFFSTHVTAGRGLGLSTVMNHVKKHSGYVYPTSELGVGTTFTVIL